MDRRLSVKLVYLIYRGIVRAVGSMSFMMLARRVVYARKIIIRIRGRMGCVDYF